MNPVKITLISIFLFLSPVMGWTFSESELESLESSGSKKLSQSPWRTQISWSLQRNALLNSSYTDSTGQDVTNPLNPDAKDSLLDISSLHYSFSLNLNYSLGKNLKNKDSRLFDWLKKTELFLSSSFGTPVLGYRNELDNYSSLDYIHYAIGDLILGATKPLYAKGDLFSDFVFSLRPFPLSRFSQEAEFLVSYGGSVNFLYFLKRSSDWSLALSSGHSLNFREYHKDTADIGGTIVNIPFLTTQSAGFIYRQSKNNYIPASIALSAGHYLGLDFEKTFNQDLSFSLRSSWKVKKRLYLSCVLSWKDRIHIYNPDQPNIELVNPAHWFSKRKIVFSFIGSYAF